MQPSNSATVGDYLAVSQQVRNSPKTATAFWRRPTRRIKIPIKHHGCATAVAGKPRRRLGIQRRVATLAGRLSATGTENSPNETAGRNEAGPKDRFATTLR